MINPLLSPSQITLWHDLLAAARHIIITCHRGPDGDAIGSTTALASWLRSRWDADIHIIAPTIFPDFLKWIPGAEDILVYEGHEEEVRPIVEAADLVILCDHGELKRMWTLGDAIRPRLPIGQGLPLQPVDDQFSDTVRCIMIDHHLDPEPGIADLVISHPELSSTCEVLLRIMLELDTAPALPVGEKADCIQSSERTPAKVTAPSLARPARTLDPSRTGRAGGESSSSSSPDSLRYYLSRLEAEMQAVDDSVVRQHLEQLIATDAHLQQLVQRIVHAEVETAMNPTPADSTDNYLNF